MGKDSKIEWTHHTFNPWWGCAKVSPACDHCYAQSFARRVGYPHIWTEPGEAAIRRTFGEKHWAEPFRWNEDAAREGVRRRVFCASMADVFDVDAPEGEREKLWKLIEATPHLDWLLLTKRIGNAARMLPAFWLAEPRPNIWLGATVVNQEEADRDIPKLLRTPARVRFLSCEPLLGPIDLQRAHRAPEFLPRVDWVIVGGESGHDARPMNLDWVRSIRDQCAAVGVAFHFKQHGEHLDGERVGKKIAGRLLDGRTWDQYPEVAA